MKAGGPSCGGLSVQNVLSGWDMAPLSSYREKIGVKLKEAYNPPFYLSLRSNDTAA